jgi:hypothetical protein
VSETENPAKMRCAESNPSPEGISGPSQVVHMGFQPFPVLEKAAKRQGDLPMLIAFRTGRKQAGISQNIASVFNKLRLAVKRMI